jgi:ribonuclease D
VVYRFMAKRLANLTDESSSDESVELPLRSESVSPVYYVDSEEELLGALENLKLGLGSLAIDAERASGFRYGNKAYLIQVHRENTDIFLIDPIEISQTASWKKFAEYCSSLTWILHAATQDLGCLAEVDLTPKALIDTELGSRILNLPRVGLGAACEQLLGFSLAKEHSAADWSIRPLPNGWLNYAALDVDVLPELARVLLEQLEIAGKSEWARQEFESLLSFRPKPQSPDRWRSMTGLHEVKDVQKLAIAREIWIARDRLASDKDTAPGRLVNDASIVALVKSGVTSRSQIASLSSFNGRASRPFLDLWWEAYSKGMSTKDTPPLKVPVTGIPNHRNWPSRHPEADARLQALKPVMAELALEHELPLENLLQPDLLRRVAWEPAEDIATQLLEFGARKWQVELVAEKISAALANLLS